MRKSLKEPITELFRAWEAMSAAVDAHVAGDLRAASDLFTLANYSVLESWLYPEWEKCHMNVLERNPEGDTVAIAKTDRDPKRFLSPQEKTQLLQRDGYRCRYCGIPVVSKEIRMIAHRLYPSVVPWDATDPHRRHMGFQALWLQFDHVVPHSHGGQSTLDNSVVCCALCNYGKDKYTLLQLALEDPRERPPLHLGWDGLERLRSAHIPITDRVPIVEEQASMTIMRKGGSVRSDVQSFFLPGAWISAGYVFTPPLEGKERWFKISANLVAEMVERSGSTRCRLTCDPQALHRRGLKPELLLDL